MGDKKTTCGSGFKAEGSWFPILPGHSLLGKLGSEDGVGPPRLAGECEGSRAGAGLLLQDVRSAPRPSSQTLSIAGSLARLINESFRLTLDL